MKYTYIGLIDAYTRQLIGEDPAYGNPYRVNGIAGAKIFLKGEAGKSQLDAMYNRWVRKFPSKDLSNSWIHNLTIKEIQISW